MGTQHPHRPAHASAPRARARLRGDPDLLRAGAGRRRARRRRLRARMPDQLPTGWDLLSYLAFEPGYIDRLIELGYDDTRARRTEFLEFLA